LGEEDAGFAEEFLEWAPAFSEWKVFEVQAVQVQEVESVVSPSSSPVASAAVNL
jgi:hypothetical protein